MDVEAPQAPAERPAASPIASPESSQEPDDAASARVALPAEPSHAEGSIVLEGRVLELATGAAIEHGTPVPGVTVALDEGFLRLGEDEGQQSSVQSGADGAFRLELPDEGKRPLALELMVDGDERFRYTALKLRLEEGESRRGGLVLARHEHGELSGRTLDVRGQPVAAVEVVLLGWDETGAALVPRLTVLSDEAGAFRFGRTSAVQELEARKSGYTLIEALRPQQREDGSWEPLEIVLCAEGTLRVQVVDPAGGPVPDVQVSATVAAQERFGATDGWKTMRKARNAVTDPSGTALLSDVWADQRLRVSLFHAGGGDNLVLLTEFERLEGDQPVSEPDRGGTPLFVEPERERTVRVELAGRYRIRGRVLEADGSAFREPWVSVRTLDRPRFAPGSLEQARRGDERGRFELELFTLHPLGSVLVAAADTGPRAFTPGAAPAKSAWAVIDLSARPGGADELTLVLSATRAIGGRIVCDPPEVGVSITAHPQADQLPFGGLVNGASRHGRSRKGEFRLAGLPAGRYDLEVVPSARYATVWVRDVEAGAEGLTIALADAKPARVTVEVVPSEGELGETILLTGRLTPHGAGPEAPELPAQATQREPWGWPPGMLQLWYGGGGHTDELGSTNYSLVPMKANPTTLELDEGLYWIGAKAKAEDGSYTFPIGTGLVRVGAGEHRLRFELPPGASVEGRVTGAAPGSELCVALARAGELLVLDVRRDEMGPLAELGHDGWFRFPLVPVGELELRVGTRADLLAGRWLRREELRVARGATVFVEVEL